MQKTLEAITQGFKLIDNYYSYEFDDGFELCIEPLLFDGQWYVALYQNQELLIPKIPIKFGKE